MPYSIARNAAKALLEDVRIAGSIQQPIHAKNVVFKDRDPMGDVIVTIKVLPEDSNIDIAKLKEKVNTNLANVCKIASMEIQEIAFGLKAIRVQAIMPDADGEIDKVESAISGIQGVGQVDTEDMSLL